MTEKDFLQMELHAIAVYNYMTEFEILEKEARRIFCSFVKYMAPTDKIPYFFYLAGLRSSSIELKILSTTPSIHSSDLAFSENEDFKSMTFNNLLKIQQQHGIQPCFDFSISSINIPTMEYPFVICCRKLISMRNKLAHERASLSFKDSDIIELLSDDKIHSESDPIYGSLSTSSMSDETKAVFSNLIIMAHALSELKKREEVLSRERMD